ncbi:MAG: hypothetical protein ACI8QI_000403 [Limisphaerales bacterium]|jgi:hypothetical protein
MLRLCYQTNQADTRKNGFGAYFMGFIVNESRIGNSFTTPLAKRPKFIG